VITFINTGAYSIPEAARLTCVPTRTARRWITGGARDPQAPLLQTDLPPVDHRHALSFLDLIDLLVVGRFREEGVSLQMVRRVYTSLKINLNTPHPFSHHRLLTDGSTIFLETLDHGGDKHLEEVLSRQKAMPEVLEPYLVQIEYSPKTDIAERWNIAPNIVLDPTRSFGKPIVADEGTTTFVLARAFSANDNNADLVADLFDVTSDAVRKAVAFENDYISAPSSPQRAA